MYTPMFEVCLHQIKVKAMLHMPKKAFPHGGRWHGVSRDG